MWLSEYFKRKKIQRLEVERAKLHGEVVKLTALGNTSYYLATITGRLAGVDERLKQLRGVYTN